MTVLRLLSAGSIRRAVTDVIGMFEDGRDVSIEADFSSAPRVRSRLMAGEPADAVIASTEALDVLAAEGRIDKCSRTVIGRTGMAVAVHRDAVVPDLSGTAAFRQAMLEADVVAYNQGSSGLHAAQLLDALGLREPLGLKVRVVGNGAEMFALIQAAPGRVYGLANVTNILDEIETGAPVRLAAHLPGDIQGVTTYEGAVVSGCTQPELAGVFVRLFASDGGKRRVAAAGVTTD